jgi:N12 class adenine-specific DNA methylase
MVSRYLADMNNGRGVSFFTGTPISNTTAESFNMMRYLMWKDLKARGIDLFDSWAANYGENLTAAEMDATGQLKQVTRFQKFKNLETLSSLLGKVMDVKYADELPGFKRPKRVDQIHTTPMSDHQKAYQMSLVQRAEALKHMTKDERRAKGADNWLAIGVDARKMAIDMRLLDPNAVRSS